MNVLTLTDPRNSPGPIESAAGSSSLKARRACVAPSISSADMSTLSVKLSA